MRRLTYSIQHNRIVRLAIAISAMVLLLFNITFTIAYAEATDIKFSDTNVLKDLTSADNFNIRDYPYDETIEDRYALQIINVVEYCYTYRVNHRSKYGLYLYIYNPKGLKINEVSQQNNVQIAVKYDKSGKPINYEKFALQFCNMSTDPDYYGLFYKYKVIDHKSADGKYLVESVNSNERKYDISGVEFVINDDINATDYPVGGSYKFTGYAVGCGPDINTEISTLDCKVDKLETIELDVNHTYYRTLTSPKGKGYQNQIDTVYFSVPNGYFERYGTLQRIKAEWYEYKTRDIVVTSRNDLYDKILPYIGKYVSENKSIGYYLYNEGATRTWGWNSPAIGGAPEANTANYLYYLFKTNNIETYDPYADITSIGGITSNALYDYIMSYDKSFNSAAYLSRMVQ